MFDVFYTGDKPNRFPHERQVDSIEQAQKQSRTRYCWYITYLADYSEFDFLWEPVPWQSEYTHAWPTQWDQLYGIYLVPKDIEIKYHYHSEVLVTKQYPENYQILADAEFDTSWVPHPWDPPYIYVFGNQWWPAEKMPTVEYRVPGATERKYVRWPTAKLLPNPLRWVAPDTVDPASIDYSWIPDPGDPPYIYQFGTQWQRTGGPVYAVSGATETKYVNYPRCIKTSTDLNWTIPVDADTSSFDWTWHPDATEPPYTYQFGTQHQRTGGPTYTVPGATEIKYVEQIKIKVDSTSAVIVEIDHLDGNAGQVPNTVKCVRYFDNYRDTLVRLANNLLGKHEFVWVCSSICDYSEFDFTWHPEQWQATMLHVFASDEQKFGDTFYMHVPTFAEYGGRKALLEWYDINFISTGVPRRPIPVITHDYDSQADAVKNLEFAGPLALFVNGPMPSTVPVVPLWRENVKTLVPLSPGASSVIVPRAAVVHVQTQLYDYLYIDKTKKISTDTLMDVVFISNSEPMAEENWQNLLALCPRAKRSDGVNGREAAYKAAAKLSATPWFFAVFAKTEVLPSFKFDFQPDRLQEPKHYIFHSRNPLNGLEYGAMNINLYNRQLTLDTVPGLDFTLSSAHAVVPIVASISRFNTDPWVTWRSAFREVLKLKREVDLGADVEIQHRLQVWCERAVGDNAEYCLAGANDALEYYARINGDYTALCLSFDWAWLKEYYYNRYQQQPWLESI